MLKETYLILDFEDKTQFIFASEGEQGKIIKAVIFSPVQDDLWNLGFGDINNDKIDDTVISNNHDIVKLISTIAKIIYEFSDEYPLRNIQIKPVDEKRKKLYNHIFRRNYINISSNFQIMGILNKNEEIYSPEIFYDFFKLKRKFVE
jgi:hypothetical protein